MVQTVTVGRGYVAEFRRVYGCVEGVLLHRMLRSPSASYFFRLMTVYATHSCTGNQEDKCRTCRIQHGIAVVVIELKSA